MTLQAWMSLGNGMNNMEKVEAGENHHLVFETYPDDLLTQTSYAMERGGVTDCATSMWCCSIVEEN